MRITVTLASATAAPLASRTMPSMVARSAWASRKLAAPSDASRSIRRRRLFMVGSLSCAGCLERDPGAELDCARAVSRTGDPAEVGAALCRVRSTKHHPVRRVCRRSADFQVSLLWIISSTPDAKPYMLHGRYLNLFDTELAVSNTLTVAPQQCDTRRRARDRKRPAFKISERSPPGAGCAGAQCLSPTPQWTVTPKKTPYIPIAMSLEVWGR